MCCIQLFVTDKARNRDKIVNYNASVAATTKLGLFFYFQFLRRVLAFRIPSLVSIVTLILLCISMCTVRARVAVDKTNLVAMSGRACWC